MVFHSALQRSVHNIYSKIDLAAKYTIKGEGNLQIKWKNEIIRSKACEMRMNRASFQ